MTFEQALRVTEAGWKVWAAKPHNAQWVKRLDGTPITNDLQVCIALAIVAAMNEAR